MARHERYAGLNEAQSSALMDFMNEADVPAFEEVEAAMQPTLFGSRRRALGATCALYASGVGNPNKQDVDGNTCLHNLLRVHATVSPHPAWTQLDTWPSLEDRIAAVIRVGVDPSLENKAGQRAMDLAAHEGCLVDMLRGMSRARAPEDLGSVLALTDSQGRNFLSAMAAFDSGGLAEVRKVVARQCFGDFAPRLTFAARPSEKDALQRKVERDWTPRLNATQVAAVARFMFETGMEQAPRTEVEAALPLMLRPGPRPAFEAARAALESGVGDIHARDTNGHTAVQRLALAGNAESGVPQERASDPADVGAEECLAVMMQLGADPFSTGDGGSPSAEQLAIDHGSELLKRRFSQVKETLKELAENADNKCLSAWGHSASAEAIDFFFDLGIRDGRHHGDHIHSSVAIRRWLRRNPAALDHLFSPRLHSHAMQGAPASAIEAYLDAIRTRPAFDATFEGNVEDAVTRALSWSWPCKDLGWDKFGTASLFNCSSDIESARSLLRAQISVNRSHFIGSLDWEWGYLLRNIHGRHPKQGVSSVDLATLLVENGSTPPRGMLRFPPYASGWHEMEPAVQIFVNETSQLWEKLSSKTLEPKDLEDADWSLLALHAHRLLVDAPLDTFVACMTGLKEFLRSTERCDFKTLRAFLRNCLQGKRALGDDKAKELHRTLWDQVVGEAGCAFRYSNKASFSTEGIVGETRDYADRLANEHRRMLLRANARK